MRRSEFEVTDPEAMARLLRECDYGVLSVISNGEPYGVAVNFAYKEGAIYFHGSHEGRKADAIGPGANVSFLVIKPFAFIPSYFSDSRWACPATHYFASVHIGGGALCLDDPQEKAFGLTALMEKMQPEGGYEPIDAASPLYAKMLEKTGVFRIVPASVTLKVKAGQNLPEKRHEELIGKLHARGTQSDRMTVEAMEALRP